MPRLRMALVSARYADAHGDSAPDTGRMILCPNCGSDSHKSNLIPEASFREAARSAKMLRKLGHLGAAADVLTRLAAVRIQNFLRCRFECRDCGATYDE